MKDISTTILLCALFFCSTFATGQSTKPTKAERKQEQKNIDSLILVKSLPIDIEATGDFPNLELRDSVTETLKKKGYECPGYPAVGNLIKERMFDFLPSPHDNRYGEIVERMAKDKNYFFQVLEAADPFMQKIELKQEKDINGVTFIRIKRHNYPNAKKIREWTFNYDESEPVNNLAARIVDTLTNTIKPQ